MNQAQTVDAAQQVPTQREIEMQFSQWFEMMQEYCSSPCIAGTLETSASPPEAGVLWQLDTEGEQR